MTITAQHVHLAAQLYAMRDKARRLLGDQYASQMAALGRVLSMTARDTGRDVLSVAIEVCQKKSLAGLDEILILSAAVELVEPSETPA